MALLDTLTGGLQYAGDVMDKFGGRAVRGTLAGRPRELLSVVPFSDTLGITDPHDIVRGHDLAGKWGLVGDEHPWLKAGVGFGLEQVTDPLNIFPGLGLARRAVKGLGAAPELSRLGQLRSLRQPFALVKDVGGDTARVIGGAAHWPGEVLRRAEATAEALPSHFGLAVQPGVGEAEGLGRGLWGFARKQLPTGEVAPFTTPAHEIAHGMEFAAAQQGPEAIARLPLWGRLAAQQRARSGFAQEGLRSGLADVLSEMNAVGIERRKDPLGYLRGSLGWAYSPEQHRLYHGQVSGRSPLAAALFHMAPGAVPGAIGGAALGGEEAARERGADYGLAGALLGGLGGAALGAVGGHLVYSPDALRLGAQGGDLAGGLTRGAEAVAPVARSAIPASPLRVPAEAPEAAGLAGRFGGQSGSLGLKYDLPPGPASEYEHLGWTSLDPVTRRVTEALLPERFGLNRADPEWINNRTFYHGTGTPGLTAATLDPRKTDPRGLYRQGIYTSDEASFRPGLDITPGYARDRAAASARQQFQERISPDNIERALREGRFDLENLRSSMENMGYGSDFDRAMAKGDPRLVAARIRSALGPLEAGATWGMAPQYRQIFEELGGVPRPVPLVYQSRGDFGKILDLDVHQPGAQRSLYEALAGRGLARIPDDLPRWARERMDYSPEWAAGRENPGALIQELVAPHAEENARYLEAMRDLGYDALTHTGGGQMGKDYHQVLIGLDPSKYRQWELYKALAGE